ncbi:MAG: zinc ribbon domain-containing protein [Anaerolineae bacterium]
MTIAESLYKLQQIDETIRTKEQRLAEVKAQLGESEELRDARAGLARAQEELHELEKAQRLQELEVQTVADKRESEEVRLYSGRVTNPKELAGLQKEVRYLKQRHAELEDGLLETMLTLEDTANSVAERRARLHEIEANWERDQATLLAERDQLQVALAEISGRRTELVGQIATHALSTYDYLCRTKGFAVAPVQHGMCTGCRVSLSAVDQQRVRSDELLTCSNCGRVLVVL